jgi:ribosomal protein S1
LNKTLTIDIYQDPTRHVDAFLSDWQKFGSVQQDSEMSFILLGRENMQSALTMTEAQITISGQIPSETFMLIDQLAKACESDKVIEGVVIDKNETGFQGGFNQDNKPFGSGSAAGFELPLGMKSFIKISSLSKAKMILLLIVALPLLILMIPIIIVITIVKIIMFKLKFR